MYPTGYLNVNGDISTDTPIVALNARQSEKATINAPAGVRNAYVIGVNGGTVNPNATSSGNVKITPNSAGTQITVEISASATASDNFIYKNGDVRIEIKIA